MNSKDSLERRSNKGLMVQSAAILYGGAAALSVLETATLGGPNTSLASGLIAATLALLILRVGKRLPVLALAAVGPIGAAVIAYALSTTPGAGDGAALYVWPVLWEAYFFGRRATILIVVWVGFVHALALLSMSPVDGYLDRWLDVVVSVGVVGAVIDLLARRNRELLDRLASEAQVDKLTGLLNRRGFEERAGEELRAVTRESDVPARMGGEEFVALVPGGVAEAKAFAERVRSAMDASADPATIGVTVSAEVAAGVARLTSR